MGERDLGPYPVLCGRRLLENKYVSREIGASNAGMQIKSAAGGNSWIPAPGADHGPPGTRVRRASRGGAWRSRSPGIRQMTVVSLRQGAHWPPAGGEGRERVRMKLRHLAPPSHLGGVRAAARTRRAEG
jgi:hypothetical protein